MLNVINRINADNFVIIDLGNYFPNAEYRVETKFFIFNGGEPHVVIDESDFKVKASTFIAAYKPSHIEALVTCRASSTSNFLSMVVAVNALRNIGIKNISLFIPYFPGARQDRVNHFGEPFTVKVYAGIVNSLELKHVYVADPHSLVTSALLNGFVQVSHDSHIVSFVDICTEAHEIYMIAPDEGALKKTEHYASVMTERTGKTVHTVFAAKKRDTKTGKIIDYKLYGNMSKNFPIFVFDDICDGGRTFVDLSSLIDSQNTVSQRFLFTTHGIFSNGFEELLKKYDKIGCSDSFGVHEHENVYQFKF